MRRLLWVALLAVTGAATLAVGQAGEEAFLEERATTCWPCHVAWSPPLRSMYNIILPTDDVPVGEVPTPYAVRVQNPWLSELVYFEPSLDLTAAPSLGFTAASDPIEGAPFSGIIVVELANITGYHEDVQIVPVPEGATFLRLTATPEAMQGPPPVLELVAWAGNRTGEPVAAARAPAPGQSAIIELDMEGLRKAGTGNWTVVTRTRTISEQPGEVFVGQDVPYTVTEDVRFDVSGERVQYLSRRDTVGPEGNTRFQWMLTRIGEPGPDERVTVRVNATSYFKHQPSSNAKDFGNFTKAVVTRVDDRDGTPVVIAPEDTVIAPTDIQVGVSLRRIGEVVGYVSTFALVFSVWTGGIFGRASRRQLNVVFGSAKRRVVFHNFLSYALTVAALAHLVLFLVEAFYHWTLGLIWGTPAMLAMFALGVTGALQVPMIRRWNYATWRWSHLVLAYVALAFTLVHLLLDGANFGVVQEAVGWQNPFDPRITP